MTTQTETVDAQTTPAGAATYHWLATVLTDDGRQITQDGTIQAVPGVHTRQSTTLTVLNGLKERYGRLTVLFFSLVPNQL